MARSADGLQPIMFHIFAEFPELNFLPKTTGSCGDYPPTPGGRNTFLSET
jgi:hypothetical protein